MSPKECKAAKTSWSSERVTMLAAVREEKEKRKGHTRNSVVKKRRERYLGFEPKSVVVEEKPEGETSRQEVGKGPKIIMRRYCIRSPMLMGA